MCSGCSSVGECLWVQGCGWGATGGYLKSEGLRAEKLQSSATGERAEACLPGPAGPSSLGHPKVGDTETQGPRGSEPEQDKDRQEDHQRLVLRASPSCFQAILPLQASASPTVKWQ